jgi:hypothetical protein
LERFWLFDEWFLSEFIEVFEIKRFKELILSRVANGPSIYIQASFLMNAIRIILNSSLKINKLSWRKEYSASQCIEQKEKGVK